jgi:AcrR family transcriptional regulator
VSDAPTGVYGGVPAAQRRAERRSRLLDAGEEILGTKGWQGTTVRAVCAGARLTPRYFYESFADREALLVAVFDRIAAEAANRVLEAVNMAPRDAAARSRAAIEAFVDFAVDDPRYARILFVEAMGSEALIRRRLDTIRLFAGLIAEQGREFFDPPQEADDLVETTAFLLAGGLAELLMAWLEGRLEVSRDRLIEDCAALFAATGEAAAAIARRRAGEQA